MGRSMRTSPPSPNPRPLGWKASVWASSTCQRPVVTGVSRGRAAPKTVATGSENVRVSRAAGASFAEGAGSTSTCA